MNPYAQIYYNVVVGKWRDLPGGGFSNFYQTTSIRHAMRLLKKHPGKYTQIDKRYRANRLGKSFCMAYWKRGKIVIQGEP